MLKKIQLGISQLYLRSKLVMNHLLTCILSCPLRVHLERHQKPLVTMIHVSTWCDTMRCDVNEVYKHVCVYRSTLYVYTIYIYISYIYTYIHIHIHIQIHIHIHMHIYIYTCTCRPSCVEHSRGFALGASTMARWPAAESVDSPSWPFQGEFIGFPWCIHRDLTDLSIKQGNQ